MITLFDIADLYANYLFDEDIDNPRSFGQVMVAKFGDKVEKLPIGIINGTSEDAYAYVIKHIEDGILKL